MIGRCGQTLILTVLAIASGTAAAGELQVNTYTTYGQWLAAVAASSDGSFVVVWQSNLSDGSSYSVRARRFASGGAGVGDDFQVNTYTSDFQGEPSVAVDADGDFVVVWRSDGSAGTDASLASVQGQRYASDGSAVGGEFQVNTYTSIRQLLPSVAMDADGDFVVVWESDGSFGTDNDGRSIQAQRYASDGFPVGGEVQVNTYTTAWQGRASVAMDADGDFVVVWVSRDGAVSDVKGQRYTSDGLPAGGEFQVNTYATLFQDDPSVAMDADGDFVAVWDSSGSSGTDVHFTSIQGQRYASDGSTAGSEFQVNTYTTFLQTWPEVASDAAGNFVVVWNSEGSPCRDVALRSVQAQRYAADGTPWGGEYQVNTYTTGHQDGVGVAMDSSGRFVMVWDSPYSSGSDSWGSSIQRSELSSVLTTRLFADGFESGFTSAWCQQAP